MGPGCCNNCPVGANASQLTLSKPGNAVPPASCRQVSNSTWTGLVRYRG